MMPIILLVFWLVADNAFIPPLVYLLFILFVIAGGIFLKHTLFKGEPASFVIELPEYRLPRPPKYLAFRMGKDCRTVPQGRYDYRFNNRRDLRKDLSRVISAERSQIINVKFLQKQGATVFYGNPLLFSNSYRIKFQ